MTNQERAIRFEMTLENAETIYKDYCHDNNHTREQCAEFNDLIQHMIKFNEILKSENTK